MNDRAEAIALARRLKEAHAGSVADCRRALLLFWYGTGASHLRLESDAPGRGDLARLSAHVAAVAADARPSSGALREIGIALDALVRRPVDAGRLPHRAGAA